MASQPSRANKSIDIYVVMGVSGCGKSTVAAELARQQNLIFIEGDDYHPPSNIEKMRHGIALTDADRAQWLITLVEQVNRQRAQGHTVVVSCSALKKAYRDKLRQCHGHVQFIHLSGSKETILNRLQQRAEHFMPVTLLDSQFATLEISPDEKDILTLDIECDLSTLFSNLNFELSPSRIDL